MSRCLPAVMFRGNQFRNSCIRMDWLERRTDSLQRQQLPTLKSPTQPIETQLTMTLLLGLGRRLASWQMPLSSMLKPSKQLTRLSWLSFARRY